MKIMKTLTRQPEQPKKLSELTEKDSGLFDKLIRSEKFKDKIVIISGGELGMGRSVTVHFAHEDANVTTVYLSKDNSAEILHELVKGNARKYLPIKRKLKNRRYNKTVIKNSIEVYGDLNVQVNNALEKPPVDNLENPSYSTFVNKPITRYKPLAIAESVGITKREWEIIPLVVDGFSNKEIAQKLHLSTYTIKSHVHNIFGKLAVNKRVQIAKYAYHPEYYKNAI